LAALTPGAAVAGTSESPMSEVPPLTFDRPTDEPPPDTVMVAPAHWAW
jgi:hypothetical protein